MTRLYIVRHGNTFEAGEPPRRIGSRTDLPLTPTGLQQADALGRWFRSAGVQFGRAFSSKLVRARASAEAIIARQPHPLVVEDAPFLLEIDHGPDEDKPEAEVVARIGRSAIELWDSNLVAPTGWDVGAPWRIAAWNDFAAQVGARADESILLVTSNGAARFALAAFGLNRGDNRSAKLRTGAYGLIEVDGGGAFRLVDWDRRPD